MCIRDSTNRQTVAITWFPTLHKRRLSFPPSLTHFPLGRLAAALSIGLVDHLVEDLYFAVEQLLVHLADCYF